MVAKSEINLFNRVKILTLKEEGFSQREISRKLQVSKSGVQKIMKKYSDWRSG